MTDPNPPVNKDICLYRMSDSAPTRFPATDFHTVENSMPALRLARSRPSSETR